MYHASLKDLMGRFLPNNILKQNKVWWHHEHTALYYLRKSAIFRSRPGWIYWTDANEEKPKVLIPEAEDYVINSVGNVCGELQAVYLSLDNHDGSPNVMRTNWETSISVQENCDEGKW